MRLTKPKSNEKNYLSKMHQKPHKHTKNISMDQISTKNDNNQSVYLHKILLKNLGDQSPDANFPNFKENIENFQSSIQNIFSNEENRQRAMKYVINMRSKRGNLSPFDFHDVRDDKNNNININNINIFSKTINDGFYDSNYKNNPENNDTLRKNYFSSNKNSNKNKDKYKGRDKKINPKYRINKPYTGFNIYSNKLEQFIPENSLMLEKKNKLYDEYQSNNKNNIYLNNITTRGKTPTSQDVINYTRTSNDINKRNFYRKKKFVKNENLYIDSKGRNKYRYIEDDNDNNDSEINNNVNYNNNVQSESDEIKYEQTFDNNGKNKLKEIIIDNINDLYQSQKFKDNNEEKYNNTVNNYYSNYNNRSYSNNKNKKRKKIFENLEIEKKRLILFAEKNGSDYIDEKFLVQKMKELYTENNEITFNEELFIQGIEKKDNMNNNNLYHKNNVLLKNKHTNNESALMEQLENKKNEIILLNKKLEKLAKKNEMLELDLNKAKNDIIENKKLSINECNNLKDEMNKYIDENKKIANEKIKLIGEIKNIMNKEKEQSENEKIKEENNQLRNDNDNLIQENNEIKEEMDKLNEKIKTLTNK